MAGATGAGGAVGATGPVGPASTVPGPVGATGPAGATTIAGITGLQDELDGKAALSGAMVTVREVDGAYNARPSAASAPNVLWIGESDATQNPNFVQWNPATGAGDMWAQVPSE